MPKPGCCLSSMRCCAITRRRSGCWLGTRFRTARRRLCGRACIGIGSAPGPNDAPVGTGGCAGGSEPIFHPFGGRVRERVSLAPSSAPRVPNSSLTRLWTTNWPRRVEGLPVFCEPCQARCVLETESWERLGHFRNALYDDLGLRQDSLFELVDAALTASHRSTLVRLSLTAAFRRCWPSTCDALADGSIDVPTLRD